MADSQGDNTNRPRGFLVLKAHVLAHKVLFQMSSYYVLILCPGCQIDVLLWATRVATILFTVGYILPIFGNPYNSYYKALMASAATSALRLHQRLPQVQFNREFLGKLIYILHNINVSDPLS